MRFAAICLVVLLATASFAVAGRPGKKIGQKAATGQYPVAAVSLTANRPKALFIRVKVPPGQKTVSHTAVNCVVGYAARASTRKFTRKGTFTRKLKMKFDRPDVCYVLASSRLAGTGTVKVQIFKR